MAVKCLLFMSAILLAVFKYVTADSLKIKSS